MSVTFAYCPLKAQSEVRVEKVDLSSMCHFKFEQEILILMLFAESCKELAELKSKHPTDEKEKEAIKQKENAIIQQIDALTMQLLQVQKHNSESNS